MDFSDLLIFIRTVVKELWINKFKVVLGGGSVAFIILFVGMLFSTTYEASTTLYADNQSILKPLLAKQAAISKVQDQVRIVRDVMLAPRILNKVATEVIPNFTQKSPADKEGEVNRIRGSLSIASLGKSYIKISYSDTSADRTYNTINKLTDLFIKDSSATQRSDSKEAFQFIDNQVKQYKSQLVNAEDGLKAFQSSNLDGTAAGVNARLAKLRAASQELTLNEEEKQIRIKSLVSQLSEESRFSAKKYKTDVYRQRMYELNSHKESLLLRYTETYPDVVAIALQIEDMEEAIVLAANSEAVAGSSENSANPLYIELRSKLADEKVALFAIQRRLSATNKLEVEEVDRRKRIAERDAELSELTRDYTVTKKIYEDMLERKEKARMSMTLSIEGQGVNYKIQEPAQYPLVPVGLTFKHFAIAGLIFGLLVPIGSIVLYLLLDPRIRFVRALAEVIEVPILAQVPHTLTPFANRIFRGDILMMGLIASGLFAAYVGLSIAHRAGIFL